LSHLILFCPLTSCSLLPSLLFPSLCPTQKHLEDCPV
jgi:hypothetical protein